MGEVEEEEGVVSVSMSMSMSMDVSMSMGGTVGLSFLALRGVGRDGEWLAQNSIISGG